MLRSAPPSAHDHIDQPDKTPPVALAGGRLLRPAEVEHYRRICGLSREELASLAEVPVIEIARFEEAFTFSVATNLLLKAIFIEWGCRIERDPVVSGPQRPARVCSPRQPRRGVDSCEDEPRRRAG